MKRATLIPLARTRLTPSALLVVIDGAITWPGYRLPSRANARMHWRKLAALSKAQKAMGAALGCALSKTAPKVVLMTRVAPRDLDDDNLASAFKSIRDGLAAAWGVDDSPAGPVVWRYSQERGDYAITVRVTLAGRA